MYSFQSKVRYSETDQSGTLRLESVVDYFQDCSTFHSEQLGLGIAFLEEHHLIWVLSAWQIEIERFPHLCDTIEIGTFPYEFKGFFGFRNFFMKDEAGEYLVKANSMWTLLDTETMRPARPPEDMQKGYELGEKLEMEYAPRKIEVLDKGRKLEEIEVKKHHIDSNHHVNNGQYVRIAMEYLPEGIRIRKMRAEYRKQAVLHDRIQVFARTEEQTHTVVLCDGSRHPYAVVEFIG